MNWKSRNSQESFSKKRTFDLRPRGMGGKEGQQENIWRQIILDHLNNRCRSLMEHTRKPTCETGEPPHVCARTLILEYQCSLEHILRSAVP